MLYLVDETKDGQKAYRTLLIEPKIFGVFNSELALKVVQELAKKPSCAMDIARKLKQHEQKIYYHIRRLEKADIIKLVGTEERVGALAKLYSVSYPFISVKLFDGEHLVDVKTKVRELDFFSSFIENGKLNATIVVGSPDPHGKYSAQASDGSAAIDFALFLGSFLNDAKPNYKLDTQTRDNELKGNLILIGGPKANILIDKINDELPIYFDTRHEFSIVSSLSKSVYPEDDVGIIVKMKNPFNKDKKVLVLSGKRFKGTRASIIGLMKYVRKLENGNKFEDGIARVVRAIDRDSDGIVDDVEFLE